MKLPRDLIKRKAGSLARRAEACAGAFQRRCGRRRRIVITGQAFFGTGHSQPSVLIALVSEAVG